MNNRSKAILTSLRLASSLLSTRISTTQSLCSQVTQFSHLSPHLSSSLLNQSYTSHFLNTHQKFFFSSKPNSIIDLVLNNEWSDELEHDLEKSNLKLTHEAVIYVLKKLDRDPEKALNFFHWVSEKKRFKPSSAIYSLLLRIFVQDEFMKQFWVTLREMKEQGFYLDEETYKTILGIFKARKMNSNVSVLTHFYNNMLKENAMDGVAKMVVDVVLGLDWSSEVEKQLCELNISLSDSFVLRVLKQLRNYPLKALSFFGWVGQHPDYEHNTITYNGIARVLGGDDSIGEFWSVVEEMKDAGHDIDIDTYIKISRYFLKKRMMEDAVKLFELMMDSPYKPSVQDCNMLLKNISACPKPNIDLVFRVVNKYESTGNSLSKAIYDGIHRSLSSVGRFDEADKITEAMRNAGFEPDNITYSQVVFGLCKARRLAEAREVLNKMEADSCVPDIKTWTILIQGYCVANEVDTAFTFLGDMIEKGLEPDADLLDVLISGFLVQNRIDYAYKLLVSMMDRVSVRPWQATYKNLIEKLLGERRLEEASSLLALMKKQNYPAYPEPFIAYISKFGTVDDAWEFLNALSRKEKPSIAAYCHVFQSFFAEGRHSEAKDLLFKCPHHIRKHDEISKIFGSAKRGKATA